MVALTITDLRTGEIVVQDVFNDAFVFEVIAMTLDTFDAPTDMKDTVIWPYHLHFADCEE